MAVTVMPKKASWGGVSCLTGERRSWLMGQRHVGGRFGDILLLAQAHIPACGTDAWDPSCLPCKNPSSGEPA